MPAKSRTAVHLSARGHELNKEKKVALKNEQQRAFLRRELEYGKRTLVQHHNQWRTLLHEVAVSQLRADVECAWQAFEHTLDSKDFLISILFDELDQSTKQAEIYMRSHMDNINDILITYHDQIDDVRRLSTKIIYALYKAGTFERRDLISLAEEHFIHLKTMMHGLDKIRKENVKSVDCEYRARNLFESGKMAEKKATQLVKHTIKMQEMIREAQEFISHHVHNYRSRQNIINALDKADYIVQRRISANWDKIYMRLFRITIMKGRFEELQKTRTDKIKQLSLQRAYYQTIFRKCRDSQYKNDSDHLKALVLISNDTIDYLKKVVADGERLLTLSAICRKYETCKEKIMCFPTFNIKLSRSSRKALEFAYSASNNFPKLRSFWNRFAAIEASRFKLLKESEVLRQQNEQLRNKLCKCLNCKADLPLSCAFYIKKYNI